MDTAFWTATRLIRALKSKKIGALELLDHYAKRIAKHDGTLNALPVLDMDAARKRAKAFDRKGAKKSALAQSIPVRRLGLPDDVARAVEFFVDPAAGFLTGQTLFVCGGTSAGSLAL